jgi:transposase
LRNRYTNGRIPSRSNKEQLAGGLPYQNLRDALERFFLRHRRVLRSLAPPPAHAQREVEASVLTRLTPQEEASRQRQERFRERFEQVQDLANKRVAPTEIAKRLGVSRQTVYKYLAMDSPPGRKGSRFAAFEILAPFRPYLLRRWNEGIRNGQQLWREVVSQGYRYSRRSVERFVGQLRRETGQPFKFRQAAPAPLYEANEQLRNSSLTALQAARLFLTKEEERRPKEVASLARLRQADPAIEQTYHVTAAFCQMLRTRQGEPLDDWIKRAKESGIPELRSFAKGLLKDYDAVKAGLTLSWSQGQTEGQVHRLKFLKRQMYGRASFPVLRQRVLRRA